MPHNMKSTAHTLSRRRVWSITISLLMLLLSGCNHIRAEAEPTQEVTPPAAQPVSPAMIAEPANIEPEPAPELQEPVFKQPETPDDLWQRMRLGFRLIQPSQQRINNEIKWYSSHPEYLERIQERAKPYLHFILEEVEKRNMPTEFALLPVVESAFQPFAYSPGRAAGLWQFIPSTGRGYGLKQNWWYDGRRDVIASTHAALDYLKALAKQYDGDWELALAAYNSGSGTVSRAIKKNRKRGKATDFWSLKLPKETRSYVPRLLAISRIIANPETYNISLKSIPNEPYLASIDIGGQLDLALAAEMAGLTINEIYQLNPAFNRWATAPDGPHRLTLPLANVDRFQDNLKQLDPTKRLRWKRYQIKPGDSLSVIARKHGTTQSLLKQVNNIRGSRIRAGKHLLIPVSSKRLSHYSLSASQRKQQLKNTKRSGSRQTYRVETGDSLWDIARAYKVNYRQLAKWNGMAPGDTLKAGQELVIWTKVQTKSGSIVVPNVKFKPVSGQSAISYRVRKGDSLSRIAQRFNVRIADLRKWNRFPGKYLQPGQKLTLYVDVTEQTL